jgi:IPT/TIG domain-containing protein
MKQKHVLLICLAMGIMLVSCRKNEPEDKITITSFQPSKGAPGNTVNIKGTGFGNTISTFKLFFNGKEAVITTLNDTLITTTVPQGTTTGKISVSSGGKSAESANDFVILPGIWVRKADLPFTGTPSAFNGGPGRLLTLGFSIGNKGYAGAGHSPNKDGVGPFLKDWWEYDTATDQWIRKADIPFAEGIVFGVSFAINDKGYIGIGRSGNVFTNEFWQYSPATDQWTRKKDFPGSWKKGAIGLGTATKGYFGLGGSWDASGGFAQSDWWEYDPATDQWTRKADFPSAQTMDFFPGFVINNRIYLGLGPNHTDKSWWEYDPSTDRWIQKADYPGIKDNWFAPGGFSIVNKGYIAGISECWEYDPVSNKWTQLAYFDDLRISGVTFTIAGKGYYTTGGGHLINYALQNDLWEFTPPN